jgi:cobalamin biosynthesis Mg chelatase CobN
VVGLFADLSQQLTQEPEADSPALRSLTSNRPAPSTRRPEVPRRPNGSQRSAAAPVVRRGSRPGPRQLPPVASGARSGYGRRKANVQQQAAAGMGRLLCLVGFVVFAVYVLPYLGR